MNIRHSTTIIIPNRTFLLRFGDISGEFVRAMVRISVGEPAFPKYPWRDQTRHLPYPNSAQNPVISCDILSQRLDIVGYQDSRLGF